MDNATPDTTPAHKPRGRPASGKPALKGRLKSEPVEAQGQVTPLRRAALVRLLSEQLVVLDDAQQVDGHSRARWQLGRIMRELVTRYEIENE
jgi:hypothetical protein